jgi:hypothetical protein
MKDKTSNSNSLQATTSAISQLIGVSQVLPGESEAIYHQGLVATIDELGAETPLQIYLAEKIYECLWWMRRYENQKRATLIRSMATILNSNRVSGQISDHEVWVMEALHANRIDGEFNELLDEHNLTVQSLNQKALANCRAHLESLDQMVTLKAKTLAGFQASYEVLVNRKVNAERMRLQNALMQRDLGAIEIEAANENASKRSKTAGE